MATALQVAAARIRYDARNQYINLAEAAVEIDAKLTVEMKAERERQKKAAVKGLQRHRIRLQLARSRMKKRYPALIFYEISDNLVSTHYGGHDELDGGIGKLLQAATPLRDGRPKQVRDRYERTTTDVEPDFVQYRKWIAKMRAQFKGAPACTGLLAQLSAAVSLIENRYQRATMPENEIIALAGKCITVEDQDDPIVIVKAVNRELARINNSKPSRRK